MYHNFIFLPLYNSLVYIVTLFPGISIGMAVIIFTILVKIVLFPLSKSSLIAQVKMKSVEPEVNKIRAQYANNRQEQGLKIMEYYRSKNIKPLSGILLVFIQLPILFALVSVFYHIIPEVKTEYLYSFITTPTINPTLFGIDITGRSLVLALLTGLAQYFQLRYSVSMSQQRKISSQNQKNGIKSDAMTDIATNISSQMRFTIPIMAFVSVYWIIPHTFPTAASIIAIYWIVSSLFTLGQELYIKNRHLGEMNI